MPKSTKSARAKRPPLILVTPDIEERGKEFEDLSISVSENYLNTLVGAGCLPVTMSTMLSPRMISESVSRCDGIVMTGGDDVEPRLYSGKLPQSIRKTVGVTPDGGARDCRELLLIKEIFRQRKPLLAICRGHQILNVAFGGTLYADLPQQVKNGKSHRRLDKRSEVVHQVRLTPGSLLAKITGRDSLDVNSTHHQAVAQVAPPFRAAAVGEDGVVEALELKPETSDWLPFLISVQFHPERLVNTHPEHRQIFRAFARACRSCQANNL